jgi:DNA processing protein
MTFEDIALTLERGVGAKRIARLIEAFGTAAQVYKASPLQLARAGGFSEDTARRILDCNERHNAEKELKRIRKAGLHAIASTDEDYPPLLREIADCPHVIYVEGEISALHAQNLSMVGTRAITQYGQRMCDELVRQLSERVPELCIVSGLAFGVDVNCHRAALRYGVKTIAVIANSLPGVVPAQHSDIACDIIRHGGAIVTELHSMSRQTGDYYIPRNRIIAALSEGTVVIEAAHDGGAMSTAEFALGYNRTVMAVPGRTVDSKSFGPNLLIKTERAKMVCSGEDIVRELMWDVRIPEVGEKPAKARAQLSADASGLMGCFHDGEGVTIDRFAELTALSHAQLASVLLELELAGAVRRLPGGMYEKLW